MIIHFYCAFEQAFTPLLGLWLEYVLDGHVAAFALLQVQKVKGFQGNCGFVGEVR